MTKIIALVLISLCIFSTVPAEEDSNAAGMEMRIFPVMHGSPDDLVPVVEQMKSPQGRVSSHANSNNLIVYDYPYVLNRIQRIVEKLDKRQKQIEIKVKILETSDRIVRELGISPSQTVLSPGEFDRIQSFFTHSTRIKNNSEMTLTTLSGSPATLMVAVEEIYPSSVFHTDGLTVITPERERSAGNFLEVIPKANNDGTITVKIAPKVSDFEGDYGTNERKILTQVIVHSGETIVLGGLNAASQNRRSGNLPFTGLAASSDTDLSGNTLMFLTVNAYD